MKLDVKKMQLIMAKRQLGIYELAKKASLSAASITSFFTGRRNPSPKSLGKLAHGLEVEVEELLEE